MTNNEKIKTMINVIKKDGGHLLLFMFGLDNEPEAVKYILGIPYRKIEKMKGNKLNPIIQDFYDHYGKEYVREVFLDFYNDTLDDELKVI